MKHPSSEQWMSYLYDESLPAEKAELSRHLQKCDVCQGKVQAWKRSMGALKEWPLKVSARPSRQTTWIKTAIAATIILGVGFLAGQMTSQQPKQIAELKKALQEEFDQKLTAATTDLARTFRGREEQLLKAAALASVEAAAEHTTQWFAEFSQTYDEHRANDGETLRRALTQLDSKWNNRFGALRSELETVAVNTESSLADLALSRPNPQ